MSHISAPLIFAAPIYTPKLSGIELLDLAGSPFRSRPWKCIVDHTTNSKPRFSQPRYLVQLISRNFGWIMSQPRGSSSHELRRWVYGIALTTWSSRAALWSTVFFFNWIWYIIYNYMHSKLEMESGVWVTPIVPTVFTSTTHSVRATMPRSAFVVVRPLRFACSWLVGHVRHSHCKHQPPVLAWSYSTIHVDGHLEMSALTR